VNKTVNNFKKNVDGGTQISRSGDAEEIEDEDEDDYGEDAGIFARSRGRRRPWSGDGEERCDAKQAPALGGPGSGGLWTASIDPDMRCS
jgi:hypothetical protein